MVRPAKRIPKIDPQSSFTPESFERELKALAAKAKDDTWGKWATEQALAYLKSAGLLTLLAISANVSQLAMSPVYGSIPSAVWHNKLVMAACFTGWSTNLWLGRQLPFRPAFLLPVMAVYMPLLQYCLYKFASALSAEWGPLATEALTLFPLVSVGVGCVADYLDDADLASLPRWFADAAPGLGSYGFYKFVEQLSSDIIHRGVGKSFLWTRMGMEILLGACYVPFAPSKLLLNLLLYTSPALIHTAMFNPHVMTPYATRALNQTLQADKWSLLDRKESVTGYVSVVESEEAGFRIMRCDHSLLGGEWVQYMGNLVAEPIYGVFTMLEAVRLVEAPGKAADKEASALVIGMGIGTTPAALVAHGIKTTVVEIDPVVVEFALKYFHMPARHTSVVEDAVTYTSRTARSTERFDYIIHDVFTGGAEPVDLFTVEFLQHLSDLLTPNGVIAINYAGDFMLPPVKMVVKTIREVFPSCRIYREHPREEADVKEKGRDFTNMVVFCTKIPGRVKFRRPVVDDLLQSRTRQTFLVPQHEVFDKQFLSDAEPQVLRQNNTEILAAFQEKSALGHWSVMRGVVPPRVWGLW